MSSIAERELQIANGLTKIITPAMVQFGMTAFIDGFHLKAVVASPTDTVSHAEVFAASCPQVPVKQHLVQLRTLLPHGRGKRGFQGSALHVFSAAAFVGDVFGTQNTIRKYKCATAVICDVFGVTCQRTNSRAPDSNSAKGSKNLLVGPRAHLVG